MEYISREEAIDKMRSLKSRFRAKNDWDSGYDTAIAEAFEHIKRVPVADVQPVKHGKWKHVAGMNSKCSVCSHYFPVTEFDSRPFDINFCPQCGAKMEGDDDNDEE